MGALFALIISAFVSVCAIASTPAGEYVGTLHHDSLGRDQLAKLDLISSRDTAGNPELIGILTLWFGDFSNHEYISFHFEDVDYDPGQGQLILDQADQSVTVLSTAFDGTTVDAELRNVWTTEISHLHLVRDGVAHPTAPLIEPVEGRYQASCEGANQLMDLRVYRYTDDTTKIGHSFSSYNVVGEFAELENGIDGTPIYSISDIVTGASYNFFNGQLDLGRRVPKQPELCQVHVGGMKCGSCDFMRISSEMGGPAALAPIGAPDPFGVPPAPLLAPTAGKVAVQAGEYQGYLHHEFLDEYQYASVSLLVYPVPGGNGAVRTSAMGRLYFGGASSPEFIIYRFNEVDYGTKQPAVILLKNKEADYDAIGQVTQITEHELKGVWYSRLYGRVGTFDLRNDGLPQLPSGVKMMRALRSVWESTDWDLQIETQQGKTPINTDNPFFPNVLDGSMTLRGNSAADHISDGSYDFYTGRIGLVTEGGRTWIGDLRTDGLLYLMPSENKLLTVLPDIVPVPFRRSPIQPY